MKKVSIIMGIFNCSDYLDNSILSIINQSYKNWELIICDDGSTDNTYRIAKEYEKKYPSKIKVLKNKTNKGLNYTLNKCLKECSGEYIARQDGDDESLPERLKLEVDFLDNNPEYAVVSTNMIFFDENGDWGKTNQKTLPSKNDFLEGSPFCHAPCMIRRDVFDKVGGYTVADNLIRVEDYHLWVKIYAAGYKGYNLSTELYKMRNDEAAIKRRTWKNRLNETNVRKIAYKTLKIKKNKWYKIYIPIVKGLIPNSIYKFLYKIKYKKILNSR